MDNKLDELRERIANAQGWTNIRKYDNGRWTGQHDSEEWGATRDNIPDWPRDIAAAWELVEEMVDAELEFEVGHVVGIWGYVCTIESPRHDYFQKVPQQSFAEDTAPEAICRAWLAWKEAEKSQAE